MEGRDTVRWHRIRLGRRRRKGKEKDCELFDDSYLILALRFLYSSLMAPPNCIVVPLFVLFFCRLFAWECAYLDLFDTTLPDV